MPPPATHLVRPIEVLAAEVAVQHRLLLRRQLTTRSQHRVQRHGGCRRRHGGCGGRPPSRNNRVRISCDTIYKANICPEISEETYRMEAASAAPMRCGPPTFAIHCRTACVAGLGVERRVRDCGRRAHTAMQKVANRNVGISGGDRSRGRFATPTDSPRHDCSPCRGLHAHRESLSEMCPSFKDHSLSPRAKP